MNESPQRSVTQALPQAELGSLLARVLSGAWRERTSAPNISAAELSSITPLLNATGDAALGWWRIRNSELADSTAGRQLHEAYRRFRLAALVHEQEIKYVFSLLRAEGIEPVLVKGWAIARLYPDRGLRPYGDIDLCVRPDQFSKAERALQCLESVEGHYVDLHSGFAKLDLGADLRVRPRQVRPCHWDELFGRSQLISLGEEKIRVLSPEDHLRVLCLHLLHSGAWRPLWLCDVATALESRAEDFDWDRCLGGDAKIAEWVGSTIGVAYQLLGARVEEHRDQRSEVRGQRAESVRQRAKKLPSWLVPAILRQWSRGVNPHTLEPALPALSAQINEPGKFFAEMYARWDQPVRSTVAVRGRFNDWPRLPYQLAELLMRSPELPKQLALMIRVRSRRSVSQAAASQLARETGS